MTPTWLAKARAYEGLREIPGPATEPTIKKWLAGLRAWWDDDETPWCGTYCAQVMKESGFPIPKHWYRALGWLDWGIPLERPSYGCIAVFKRKGGGHVGFVVGMDAHGNLVILGGNQNDAVREARFPVDENLLGFRWPSNSGLTAYGPLPVVARRADPAPKVQ